MIVEAWHFLLNWIIRYWEVLFSGIGTMILVVLATPLIRGVWRTIASKPPVPHSLPELNTETQQYRALEVMDTDGERILRAIADFRAVGKMSVDASIIAYYLKMHSERVEVYFDRLWEQGYIQNATPYGTYVSITPLGRAYLVERGLI